MTSYPCPICKFHLPSLSAFFTHAKICTTSESQVLPIIAPVDPLFDTLTQQQRTVNVPSTPSNDPDSLKRQYGKDHLALDIGLSPPTSIASLNGEEFCWVPRDYFPAAKHEWHKKVNAKGEKYTEKDHAYALITKAGKQSTPIFIEQVVSSINELRTAVGKDLLIHIRFKFLNLVTEWMLHDNQHYPTVTIAQASDVLEEMKLQPLSVDTLDRTVLSF
jgi:hypothetical protein